MHHLRILIYLYLLLCCAIPVAWAQTAAQQGAAQMNQTDRDGKRNGMWWLQQPAMRGEEPYIEFGSYDHGLKLGPWYRINNEGDIVSIENFRFDVKHGEAKYFEQGHLVCMGNFRGLNPQYEFDTVDIIDPVTHVQTTKVIPADRGSVRHGTWKYFDANTGHLLREEEYQMDELIRKKDFKTIQRDSTYYQQREQNMPHNKPVEKKLPAGKKQVSYTEY